MKKIISLLFLVFMTTLISCSSTQVNEVKIGAAEKLGSGVASFLTKEYVSLPAEMNCQAEAKALGGEVEAWAKDKLKVKETKMASLSAGGEIARLVCGTVASKFLPEFMYEKLGKYPCFAKRSANYTQDFVSGKLCDSISF